MCTLAAPHASSPRSHPSLKYTLDIILLAQTFLFCAQRKKSSVTLSESKVFMASSTSNSPDLNIFELTVSGFRFFYLVNNLFLLFVSFFFGEQ